MSTIVPPLRNVGRRGSRRDFFSDRNSRRSAVSTSSDIVRRCPRGLTLKLGHNGVVNIKSRLHIWETRIYIWQSVQKPKTAPMI